MSDPKEKKDTKADTAPKKQKVQELSDEDKEYKKNIEQMIDGLLLPDADLRMNSYNLLKTEITTSTSSMTSIPKPLKFARVHYDKLKTYYSTLPEKDKDFKNKLSDLLAVLVMVVTDTEETSLSWILKGERKNITEWGQEFIKALSADISTEYNSRLDKAESTDELINLVKEMVPFLIEKHCENDAIDLLIEVERLNDMLEFVNENNYKKICLYLISISKYAADTEEFRDTLELVYTIYFTKFHEYVNAMRVAIKMGNSLYIKQTYEQCKDKVIKKQLAFILAREKMFIETEEEDEELIDIMSNMKLSDYYKRLGKELEVLEPKHPEDVFKSHLENKKQDADKKLESYKINMAFSIASSFINAGFGTEVLLSKDKSDWLYKNKDEGMIALLGGLGLVHIWDTLEGPGKLYEYAGNSESDVMKRSGRNIGMGICSIGIHDDNNTAIAALLDELEDKNMTVKESALLGLGFAAAGSQNEDLKDSLLEAFQDFQYGFELSAFISLAFGLIYLGSAKEDVFDELFAVLLTRNDGGRAKLIDSPYFVLYAMGMGLICLGKQKDVDFMIETISTLQEFPIEMRMYLKTMLTAFAYAGTGNVTKVQELMHLIALPKEECDPRVQTIAVIGTSLIAIGEEMGSEMLLRSFNHFQQFGNASVKKAVPLAMALLNLSYAKVSVVDAITKFCYDTNKDTAINAIFSLGLVSSGTNHSRVAGLLRNLAAFYSEETNPLFIIRIAQGLLHMGKGMMTINPLGSHNLLINNVGLAGVLISIFSFTEAENLICGKNQSLMYSLALAMQPRMVMTVDENLEPKPVQLMVGQSVDVVGQQGNPRTITGFQIHNSPALISTGERCEISGDEYVAYTDVLENIVIVKENKERKKQ